MADPQADGERATAQGAGPARTRFPDLGPHGEGWFIVQVGFFAVAFAAGFLGPAWSGWARLAGQAIGMILMAAGGTFATLGLAGLREGLTPFPRPRAGARLVDTGAYRVVRHPIYTGIICGAIGWALVMASPAALGAAGLLLGFFDLKARREEAWLLEAYPGYAAYRRRVRKLIPYLY